MDSGKRILERDGHFLNVADASDGKLILLITSLEEGIADGFTIGLTPASLADLRASARVADFDWTIRDGSLRVEGRGAAWTLTFTMTSPPFASTKLALTGAETARFRAALVGGAGH